MASSEGRISAGREVAGSLEVVAAETCSAQEFVGWQDVVSFSGELFSMQLSFVSQESSPLDEDSP